MIILSEMFEEGRQFLENPELFSNFISNMMKVAIGELLEGHIGVELANIFFQRLKEKIAIHVRKDTFKRGTNRVAGAF